MALLTPGGAHRRPFSLRGVVNLVVRDGQLYARKWRSPNRRPSPPWKRATVRRHVVLQRAVKYTDALHRRPLETALQAFLDANRGIRGTAAIRLRDWLTQIMTGRMWTLRLPDGTAIHSAAVVRDCSDFLDLLEPRIGSLVVRTDTTWLPTVQCTPGAVLTMAGDSVPAGTCPPASLASRHDALGGY